jgi:anaerobic selenocysteine-containing dehydrogenase
MAVHSLNALLGSIDVPGGVLVQQPLPGEVPDDRPGPGSIVSNAAPFGSNASQLPRAILSRRPYPVQVLLINHVNPVFSLPNGEDFQRALREVPFVVSSTSFMHETSVLADLVLPTPTGLEAWQDMGSPPAAANAMVSVSPPAVRSRKDVRHVGDVVLSLAHSLGGSVAAALPFSSYEQYLRRQVDELFAAQSGAVFGSKLEETWNGLMERSGWWAPTYSTADELWQQVKQQGGWWEPAYSHGEWSRVLRTPSGRFEFYSQALAQAARKQAGSGSMDDRVCLPHQPKIADGTPNFPLLLLPVEGLPLSGGEGAHLPYLQQIAGEHLFANWDSWLEIHPETARQYGIKEGDNVWIESARGRVRARARLYEGARPGVVHLPLGYGHTAGNEWACRGVNPLRIVGEQQEPWTGLPQVGGTYVKVYRL